MNLAQSAVLRYIRFYGYFILAGGIYGIAISHIPVILGHQWSVCMIEGVVSIPCVLTIHLYDGSLAFFLLFFSWYSLKKATLSKISQYLNLLIFVIAIEIAFFTFEAVELIWNFHNQSPSWENYIIGSIAIVLLIGFLIGIYINQRILHYLSVDKQEAE